MSYKVKIAGKEYPFKWSIKAIKLTQEECKKRFNSSFEDAVVNEHSYEAYATALFYGVKCAGVDKIEGIEDPEDIGLSEAAQAIKILSEELKKLMEAAGTEIQDEPVP